MANDFSFLIMDMEFRGRGDLARALVARSQKRLYDPTFDLVLPFYQCHRSLVRGKVRGLAWLQHPRTAQGRRVRELSRRHFRLAIRYARQFAPPKLLVVGGLIGTGKSTLAKSLAELLGAAWLRTDEIRLTEFAHLRRPFDSAQDAIPSEVEGRRREQGFAQGLYASRVSEQVYQRLIRRAERLVRQGRSVVCDGTFSKAAGRQALRQIAKRHGASFHFFECIVPRVVALRRVATRYAKRTDFSEARPEHYDQLRAGFEPVHGWPARDWTRLSDHRPPEETLQAALKALRHAWKSLTRT
jgi:predicted kinase